ncbi:hypothetical protein OKA04_19975 [Luteolibacter flavescens]|uniref:Linalool dehydratase/isomerase domain-containing protein n=1 Tax=Luteolibacter flavescens TaxID=1859460 RepID=A0ABT3FTW6_9BACT|nr:hypothetical protein [Luteolibacter flavescens]MCW1887026.1 hypothetical protein [Luteolibacter flavescens]
MKKLVLRTLAALILTPTLAFVVFPFAKTAWYLVTDTGLRSAAPSTFAFNLHASLSRRLPGYVDERIASGVAETLKVNQITATESPVYGAFFYLLATENLQAQWEADPTLSRRPPKETGKDAIEACTRIILDPGHAHWVRTYWGDDYLDDPNCFYRMLVIGSLAAHHHLTGKTEHLPILKQLTADLAADIDASPYGLVDDYPSQCFPADVVAGIAMIRRADPSRAEWARKAFHRMMENFPGQLPPYMAIAETGEAWGPSRGCTNGFFFSYARDLDPAAADALYGKLVTDFWQVNRLAAGWREFPNDGNHPDSYIDADSGPVIWGFGTGATGLGIGSTRIHGDHEKAGMLGAEMLAGSIPLPDGSLLLPLMVSDLEHAPHFAETVILHQLSLSGGGEPMRRAPLTGAVWLILGVELVLGILLLRLVRHLFRRSRSRIDCPPLPA